MKKTKLSKNLLSRQTFLLQELEVLHQIANGEICRITLPVIAKLLAGLECGNVGNRQLLAAIAASLEDGANQVLVLPGEAAKQNGYPIPLVGGEGSLYGTMKMCGLVQASDLAQPGPFCMRDGALISWSSSICTRLVAIIFLRRMGCFSFVCKNVDQGSLISKMEKTEKIDAGTPVCKAGCLNDCDLTTRETPKT